MRNVSGSLPKRADSYEVAFTGLSAACFLVTTVPRPPSVTFRRASWRTGESPGGRAFYARAWKGG